MSPASGPLQHAIKRVRLSTSLAERLLESNCPNEAIFHNLPLPPINFVNVFYISSFIRLKLLWLGNKKRLLQFLDDSHGSDGDAYAGCFLSLHVSTTYNWLSLCHSRAGGLRLTCIAHTPLLPHV